ncbi:MAG: riboflavin synthase [Candidatus Sumerlaeota bacterium]|nr:riboflavin synthase [Candidatus Sumerlaeota bacterium]
MFTGLIQEIGRIVAVAPNGGAARFEIAAPVMAPNLGLGESVAVDGCCLTVEAAAGPNFKVFASSETLARTTLKNAFPGTAVNLERALTFSERLGGHFVSGHVDGQGRLTAVQSLGDGSSVMTFDLPEELASLAVAKGSIAIDGISLTIARLEVSLIKVAVIPETLARTTLGRKRPRDPVNIETDLLGKYILRQMERIGFAMNSHETRRPGAVTMDKLTEAGF